MTYVLITRPAEDCQALAHQILAPLVCEPMLMIKPRLNTLTLDPSVTDLIITSSRVFDLIVNIQDYRKKPVWCVGDITAELAKEKGFETIYVAERSAQELLEKIVQESHREKSFFVHLRGDKVHVDVVSALNHVGFHAEHIIVYETQVTDAFSPRVKALFKDKLISLIPFYSQRTAEVFVEIVNKTFSRTEIVSLFKNIRSLAHSEAVAQKLGDIPWKSLEIVQNLSAPQIDTFYLKYFGPKKEISAPKRLTPPPPQKTNKAQLGLIAVVAITSSLLSAIVFSPLISPLILAPNKNETKQGIYEGTITSIEDRLKITEHKIQDLQNSQEQEKRQPPSSEFPLLPEIEVNITNLNGKMDFLSERVSRLEESHLQFNEIQKQNKLTPAKTQESSPNSQIFITYQRLLGCQHNLLISEVSSEDQNFLIGLGIPALDVFSIPQLLNQLEPLDLTYFTEKQLETEGFLGRIMRRLDIKVQHKSTTSLKNSIMTDLQKRQFTFLDPSKLSVEEISQLSQEAQHWLEKARQTAHIKDLIMGQITKIQASSQPVESIPVVPSIEVPPILPIPELPTGES